MEIPKLLNTEISDVAATSLITLYCHALESKSKYPILDDPLAVEITNKLNPELSQSDNKLYQSLAKGKVEKNLVVHIAMRAKRYDDYARNFLERSHDGIVVNIACGLDTRFHRIDNGKVIFYDLDLPEVIAVKKKLLPETERYRFIPSSVLNYEWMEAIKELKADSVLFMAEGLFMYLQEEEVKSLVLKLQSTFPGCEIIAEFVNAAWLKPPLQGIMNRKLQRDLQFGKDATFKFGIRDSKDLESWNPGIEFLDDWFYLDEPEKKLGLLKIFRDIPFFRKIVWTARYKLN
ncbi:MAG: class I SAM-dependent methyltransferase [Moorea sp. SIO3I7]|uniref:class I SAM-dependent methyltransferase n=1 Tax=unclassified Moorena TaxID=2683338 RepID=UPI0013CABABB|nr:MULTISPECIES: class I SAM-dependent methyltransferase [unclassified Moorena]NEO01715.1 class I SAM-dependent methyltransferase [Moorena sp. SIO3I7]NEO13594.1 class I SAM-dependent methyltransferase [Moorena sp. SIO3E8]NEP99940.1 class I SAM-dependent methyltransferase [Moorena sp. SIO3F7]